MVNRRTFLAAIPISLAGCATSKSVSDGAAVRPNQGILALRLSSNRSGRLGFTPYGESTFGARFAENMFGAKETLLFKEDEDRFLIIPVDAGEYMWSKLEMGNQYAWLLESTRFRVRAGQITYIGNLRVFVNGSKFSVRVADREDEMREHLRSKFPSYSNAFAFTKTLAELNI